MSDMFYKIQYTYKPLFKKKPHFVQLFYAYDAEYYKTALNGIEYNFIPDINYIINTHFEVWKYYLRFELEERFGKPVKGNSGKWFKFSSDPLILQFRHLEDAMAFKFLISGQSSSTVIPLYRNFPLTTES